MREGRDAKDLGWALGAAVAGGAAILLAMRAGWMARDLSPGVEGLLTTSVIGFVMALLHGLGYRRSLALSAPVIAAQYLVCARTESAALALGISGLTLVFLGFVGLAIELGRPVAAPITGRPRRAARPAHTSH